MKKVNFAIVAIAILLGQLVVYNKVLHKLMASDPALVLFVSFLISIAATSVIVLCGKEKTDVDTNPSALPACLPRNRVVGSIR